MVLYGAPSGAVLWEFGIIHVTEGSVQIGTRHHRRASSRSRCPRSCSSSRSTRPTSPTGSPRRSACPRRFVLGALAGAAARRLVDRRLAHARAWLGAPAGIADRGVIRRSLGQAFALLVLAIRRGSTLATAMEARGFGAPGPRTWARTAHFGRTEWVVVAVGCLVAAVSATAAIATGSWNVIWS